MCFVEWDRATGSIDDVRPFDVGEAGAHRLPRFIQPLVNLAGDIADLGPDILTFTIAVGPDVEDLGVTCLRFDVLRNGFLAVFHKRFDARIEKPRRLTGLPAAILRFKVVTEEMPGHGCHGHIALAPCWEVILELVILGKLVPGDAALKKASAY